MKKILILSTAVFLITSVFLLAKEEDKKIVPLKPVTKATNVTDLIKPILTNISILAKYTFKVAANFREIKRSAEKLKPDVECLGNPKATKCKELNCETLSKCTGTTLSDFLKVTYPFLEAILGSVESNGTTVRPGSLFAIVDSAEKIPGVIPSSLYTKLKVENYKTKVDSVVLKLSQFRDKLPTLTKNFNDAMAMLNGIIVSLNPIMLVDTMPIKPVPPVDTIKDKESLSKNIAEDIEAA